jgi:glycosidase
MLRRNSNLLVSLLLLCVTTIFDPLFSQSPKTLTTLNTPVWAEKASIYEVNIRQFSTEGTFTAFEKHLPRLKDMGIDILWLMPIHPIGVKNRKGTLGSYYAVKDYRGINPEYGNETDFKHLVKTAHSMGFKIIIDWVANHTSPDAVWAEKGWKNWYTLDSLGNLQPTLGTDWWDVADLNYENKDMRAEMISSMKYWITEYDIDGFRCDVADWVPVDFWVEARNELDKVKKVFMLAEAENPEHHVGAFDMSYGWEFHHILNDIAQGKKGVAEIYSYFERERTKFPANAYRMHFTSNHDENSWNGTEKERMGDARLAMAVIAATIDGMPLIYNGQEASLDRRLKFFDKDSISWDNLDLVGFYTKLLGLKHSHPALLNGVNGAETVFLTSEKSDKPIVCYTREKNGKRVTVIANLSETKQQMHLDASVACGSYTDLFNGRRVRLTKATQLTLDPWEYKVLFN